MRTQFLTSMTTAFIVAAAAAGLQPLAAQQDTQAESVRDIKVTVINNNWADVRVYAVSASYTVRLGTVSSLGEATFTVPRSLPLSSGDFQLAIRPIGQRVVHYSQPILASPGDTVEFRVQNHLGLSSAIVY